MGFRDDFLWGGATAANQCEVDMMKVGVIQPMWMLFQLEKTVDQLLPGK